MKLYQRIGAALGMLATLVACQPMPKAPQQWTLRSPDGGNSASITLSGQILQYSLLQEQDTLLLPSRLGVQLKEGDYSLFRALRKAETRTHKGQWEQPWGEQRLVDEHYNELALELENAQGQPIRYTFRMFDDGLGFRYEIPLQGRDSLRVTEELTEFRMPGSPKAFWMPGGPDNFYEGVYRATALSAIDTAETPATFRLENGRHLALHEAAIVDYASMTLVRQQGSLRAHLIPWKDGLKVRLAKDLRSPWRTVLVGKQATDLLSSTMILNLNEPNKLGDVSWVKPMRYMGIWWDMHLDTRTWKPGAKHGATTAYTQQYLDYAAQHGFGGVLVEGWNKGWEEWKDWSFTEAYPDFDLPYLQAYAQRKGLTLIGHHETSGRVTSEYEPQLKDAMALYGRLGVKAVKTGYVGGIDNGESHRGQWMVGHYQRVVEEAAKNKVAVVAHEPIKDSGLRRTYPNFISREGARGQEYNAWGNPPNQEDHEVMLAYTRMLSGPLDFTPGVFQLTYEEYRPAEFPSRVKTTLAKQLALYVVLYSPVQMACDLPKHYDRHPDMFAFVKEVPTDWEKSVPLAGEVGEYVAFARKDRQTDHWYLGAITNADPRSLELALDFLEEGRTYELTTYADGPAAHWEKNPYDYRIERRMVRKGDKLSLKLGASGGAAASLKPKRG